MHAAGIVDQHVPAAQLFAVNAGATERMAAWAAARGCPHFVQFSSVSVYGPRAMGHGRTEDTTPRSLRASVPYGRSKALAEVHVERSGVPYSLLRVPMVVGVGDVFVTPVVAGALRDGSFFLGGRGEGVVSLITVPNLGPLIDAALKAGPLGAAANVASHAIPWREQTATYADALGVPYQPRRAPFPFAILRGELSEYMLLYGMSRFGGEYPTGRFEAHLAAAGVSFDPEPWADEIRAAVAAFE